MENNSQNPLDILLPDQNVNFDGLDDRSIRCMNRIICQIKCIILFTSLARFTEGSRMQIIQFNSSTTSSSVMIITIGNLISFS